MISLIPTISAAELTKARQAVGLSAKDLAVLLEVPAGTVERWEAGGVRVPFQLARQARWRMAVLARARAIAASEIPECEWINQFDEQPEPRERRERDRFMREWHAHTTSCAACLTRAALLKARFPDLPPPMPLWLDALALLIGEHTLLPRWMGLGVPVGLLFCIGSIAHVDFPLLRLIDRPGPWWGLLDVTLATVLGAVLGVCAGMVRNTLVGVRSEAEKGQDLG